MKKRILGTLSAIVLGLGLSAHSTDSGQIYLKDIIHKTAIEQPSEAEQEIEPYDIFYYIDGGKKQQLTHEKGKVSVITDKYLELDEIKKKLNQYSRIENIENLAEEAFIIKHSYENELEFLFKLRNEQYIKAADIVFGEENKPHVLTGAILLYVLEGKEAEFFNAMKNEPITSIEKLWKDSRIYKLEVDYKKTMSNALNLSNKYYMLDFIKWSEPNCFISIDLF